MKLSNILSMNLEEVFGLIAKGEINDSKTICALTRAFKL